MRDGIWYYHCDGHGICKFKVLVGERELEPEAIGQPAHLLVEFWGLSPISTDG